MDRIKFKLFLILTSPILLLSCNPAEDASKKEANSNVIIQDSSYHTYEDERTHIIPEPITKTGISKDKLVELEVTLNGLKTGNPKRISNKTVVPKTIPCIQPKPQIAQFENPEMYSFGDKPLVASGFVKGFLKNVEPKFFDTIPNIQKGKMDSVLAGIPEVITALPGTYLDKSELNILSITISQGLPVNSVYDMDQDQDGNYWMTTALGLVKYDGLKFYLYGYEQGLKGLYRPLIIDKKGNVWIGGGAGPVKFDGTYFISYRNFYKSPIHDFIEDSEGNMLAYHGYTGGGMALYGDGFVKSWSGSNWSDFKIRSMAINEKGELWGGTEFNGLFYIKGDKIWNFKPEHGLKGRSAGGIALDENGLPWFNSFNYSTGKSTLLHIKKGNLYTYDFEIPGIEVTTGTDGEVWMVMNDKIVKIKNNRYQEWDIQKVGERQFIFNDNNHNIWIGNTGGLQRIKGNAINSLSMSDNTYGVIHGLNGTFWTAVTNGGFFLYRDGVRKRLKLNGRDYTRGVCHLLDSKGRYWIGTLGGGLYMYDGKYLRHYTTKSGLPNNWVIKLIEDKNQNLWMTTNGSGAVKFDGAVFTVYTESENKVENPGMIGNSLHALFQASDSSFWFSDMNGEGICQLKNDKYVYYRVDDGFPEGTIDNFVEDDKGTIWATGAYNLVKISENGYEEVPKVTEFPEPYGYAGIKDDLGNLWFAHQNYISVYTEGKYITIDIEDGFKGAGNFNNLTTATKDKNGLIWFGANPAVSIDPEKFLAQRNAGTPAITITDVLLQNKRIHYRELQNSDSLKATLEFARIQFDSVTPFSNCPQALILPHNINEIFFQFTVNDEFAQHKIKTTYRLEGLTDEWSELSKNYSAKFTNLNYGDYCFVVKAQNQFGIWSKDLRYNFSVNPPWWHTWWARAAYILFSGLCLLGVYKWRTATLKAQKRILRRQVAEATAEIRVQKEEAERQTVKAEQSEAFKQQFLANMSHEIRTPMNAVMGMTNLVLDTKLDEQQKFYLERVKKSSDNLLHIINDILDLSKIEAGKMELEEIDFSIAEMVDQVKQTLKHKAEEKGLELAISIHKEVKDVVLGDPVRLNQVLINLVNNAIKFTEKGSVNLVVTAKDASIQFSIVDTGIGIPEDKLQSIFETFSQANASDTRIHGGTGLGLSISRYLVELMGSEISIESKVGMGTTFSFNIAFKKGSSNRLNKRIALEESVDGSILDGLRILVTDDNEYNRIVARDTLISKAKVEVFEAENGEEAIKLLEEMDFDAILMDVQMPVMNGFDATLKIRAMEGPKKDTPIIALTASVLRSDLDKCKEAGMDSYIPKPFKPQELITNIAQVLHIELRILHEKSKKIIALGNLNLKKDIVDLTYLIDFCEGNTEKMKKYMGIYLKSVPGLVEVLEKAIQENDVTTIANQVHGFKARLGMMGVKGCLDLANQLERTCREEPTNASIANMVDALIKQILFANTELDLLYNELN